MEIDQALEAAKPVGRMQIMIAFATMLMHCETVLLAVGGVFFSTVPPYLCSSPHGLLLNESIPMKEGLLDSCQEYINSSISEDTQPCSNGWEFDTHETGHSIISDWDLVCYRDYLPALSQSFLLAGFGLGSLLFGPLADRYGRKPIIIASLILFNAIGFAVSAVQNIAMFVILRFLAGFIFKGIRIPIINLLFETLVPRHRPLIGIIPAGMASASLVMLAGIAYFIRDWRILNVVLQTPTVILMLSSMFLPESVRWLLSQNKFNEAEKVMQRIASFNGSKDFPSPALSKRDIELKSVEKGNGNKKQRLEGVRLFFELFRQPTLTVTLILSWQWLTCNLSIFGFALSTSSLPGSRYVTFAISSSTDILALCFSLPALKKFGNLRSLIFGLSCCGVATMVIAVLPYVIESETDAYGTTLITFALLGRLFSSFSGNPMLLLMGDLFPTTVRNTGTAVVHLIGNIGSILAPQLLYLNKFFNNGSFLITGICLIVGAGLCLMLPESSNTIHPETPGDLQILFDTKRLVKCGRGKPRGDECLANTDQENS